jgi:hypothetical protein
MMTEFDEQATSRDAALRGWLNAYVKYLVDEETLAVADGYEMAARRCYPFAAQEI